MSGLIDWESCDTRTGRACHRRCGPGSASTRTHHHRPGQPARRAVRAATEFAILRPVLRLARRSAARTPCRRSARRSSMDRTSAS